MFLLQLSEDLFYGLALIEIDLLSPLELSFQNGLTSFFLGAVIGSLGDYKFTCLVLPTGILSSFGAGVMSVSAQP